MKVYIDTDCKCHVANDGTMLQFETAFFDGKCKSFVEGYRFVPDDETWVREDGAEFTGEMVTPWKPYEELEKAQAQWEHAQLAIALSERDALLDDMQALIDEILGGEGDV